MNKKYFYATAFIIILLLNVSCSGGEKKENGPNEGQGGGTMQTEEQAENQPLNQPLEPSPEPPPEQPFKLPEVGLQYKPPVVIPDDKPAEYKIKLGGYKTQLIDRSKSRVKNISIASETLDGYIIEPGEEFSFNRALGKRTREKGYELAPIIVRTKDGPKSGYGRGGGICQVASTLYNAALEAGMDITERHRHSKKVNYVPEGRDATVVYNGADLRFVNSTGKPIMIKTRFDKKSLSVELFTKA